MKEEVEREDQLYVIALRFVHKDSAQYGIMLADDESTAAYLGRAGVLKAFSPFENLFDTDPMNAVETIRKFASARPIAIAMNDIADIAKFMSKTGEGFILHEPFQAIAVKVDEKVFELPHFEVFDELTFEYKVKKYTEGMSEEEKLIKKAEFRAEYAKIKDHAQSGKPEVHAMMRHIIHAAKQGIKRKGPSQSGDITFPGYN